MTEHHMPNTDNFVIIEQSKYDNYINFSYTSKYITDITDDVYLEMKKYKNVRLMHMNNVKLAMLPRNIVQLELYECASFNEPLDILFEFTNLKEFSLESCEEFNQPLAQFPAKLERLNISTDATIKFPISNLPESLRALSLDFNYEPSNGQKTFTLPPNLEVLSISWDFNFNDIPDTIKTLSLLSTNRNMITKLPNNLENIIFGFEYAMHNISNFQKILRLISKLETKNSSSIKIKFLDGDNLGSILDE